MKKLDRIGMKERGVKSMMPRRQFKGVKKNNTPVDGALPAGRDFYLLKEVMDDHITKQLEINKQEPVALYTITMKLLKYRYSWQLIKQEVTNLLVEVNTAMDKHPNIIYNVVSWKKVEDGKVLFKTASGQYYVLVGEIDRVRRQNNG